MNMVNHDDAVRVGSTGQPGGEELLHQGIHRWCFGVVNAQTGETGWRHCGEYVISSADMKVKSVGSRERGKHNHAGKVVLCVRIINFDEYPLARFTVLYCGASVGTDVTTNFSTLPGREKLRAAVQEHAYQQWGDILERRKEHAQRQAAMEFELAMGDVPGGEG